MEGCLHSVSRKAVCSSFDGPRGCRYRYSGDGNSVRAEAVRSGPPVRQGVDQSFESQGRGGRGRGRSERRQIFGEVVGVFVYAGLLPSRARTATTRQKNSQTNA